MSRFVTAVPRGLRTKAAAAGEAPAREYLERVAKYVPAEIIAGYTAIINGVADTKEPVKSWTVTACLFICAILTPVYFKLLARPEDKASLRTQQVVSFFAFLVWAYSITGAEPLFGGTNSWFVPGIATALLTLFTLISGLIVPKQ